MASSLPPVRRSRAALLLRRVFDVHSRGPPTTVGELGDQGGRTWGTSVGLGASSWAEPERPPGALCWASASPTSWLPAGPALAPHQHRGPASSRSSVGGPARVRRTGC